MERLPAAAAEAAVVPLEAHLGEAGRAAPGAAVLEVARAASQAAAPLQALGAAGEFRASLC